MVLIAVVALSCGDDDDKSTGSTNRPPVISSITADPDTILEGDITTVTVAADDPDGHALSYNWESRSSWLTALTISGGTADMINCCPISGDDSTFVIVTVSDGHGGSDSDSVRIWIELRT